MAQKRYLTKSRFKLGIECPTKLFYTAKKDVYADQNLDDPFLRELANGGFQVGELAKQYFPDGVEVKGHDYNLTLDETNKLLAMNEATIFEAAVSFENLLIRVDVLRKRGSMIEVIEVKSKSCSGVDQGQFLNQTGTISNNWLAYFYDIAFQKYVVQKAFPGAIVSGFLMLADKTTMCPTDGLNQKFRVATNENNYKEAFVAGTLSSDDLSEKILTMINSDGICDLIYQNKHINPPDPFSFEQRIEFLADNYVADARIKAPLTKICRDCQFKATAADKQKGLVSGFEECWKDRLGWSDDDFAEPTLLDVWDFRKKDDLLEIGIGKMADIPENVLTPKSDDKPGISRTERQWLQIEKVKHSDSSPWIDRDGLRQEFSAWKFPLHFIDFETSMAAIPFLKGHRPYEPIAFQFSHHIVNADGSIIHAGQFLNGEPGVFPNFDFLRALKAQLENDQGTIFRYADHENTYLNMILERLLKEPSGDGPELIEFIKSITRSSGRSLVKWEGKRNMVDLLRLVKRYYYDPFTNGSNSIKFVLPAIMRSSAYLRKKYSEPIYGGTIPSLNFENMRWVTFDNGEIVDPYKLLPKMFGDVSENDYAILSESDEMGDGGAAMSAYAKLQFEDLSDYERQEITAALLRYCELDTLAMVMIYEAWREMI